MEQYDAAEGRQPAGVAIEASESDGHRDRIEREDEIDVGKSNMQPPSLVQQRRYRFAIVRFVGIAGDRHCQPVADWWNDAGEPSTKRRIDAPEQWTARQGAGVRRRSGQTWPVRRRMVWRMVGQSLPKLCTRLPPRERGEHRPDRVGAILCGRTAQQRSSQRLERAPVAQSTTQLSVRLETLRQVERHHDVDQV
jgi:hypothetical protein